MNESDEMSNHTANNLRPERLIDFSRAENKINSWVFIGYIVSLFGGIFGIFIATFLINAKKALADGRIIHAFNERSRKHGKIILYLSSVILIISILFFLNWLFLTLLFSNKLHLGSLFQSLPAQAFLFL